MENAHSIVESFKLRARTLDEMKARAEGFLAEAREA